MIYVNIHKSIHREMMTRKRLMRSRQTYGRSEDGKSVRQWDNDITHRDLHKHRPHLPHIANSSVYIDVYVCVCVCVCVYIYIYGDHY